MACDSHSLDSSYLCPWNILEFFVKYIKLLIKQTDSGCNCLATISHSPIVSCRSFVTFRRSFTLKSIVHNVHPTILLGFSLAAAGKIQKQATEMGVSANGVYNSIQYRIPYTLTPIYGYQSFGVSWFPVSPALGSRRQSDMKSSFTYQLANVTIGIAPLCWAQEKAPRHPIKRAARIVVDWKMQANIQAKIQASLLTLLVHLQNVLCLLSKSPWLQTILGQFSLYTTYMCLPVCVNIISKLSQLYIILHSHVFIYIYIYSVNSWIPVPDMLFGQLLEVLRCRLQRLKKAWRRAAVFSLLRWGLEPNIAFGRKSLEIQWELFIL